MRAHSMLIILSLIAAPAIGCSDSSDLMTTPSAIVRGSGRFVTESRAVGDFTSVAVAAGVRAIVTQGAAESLEVTAEDNILPLIESAVVNGRLEMRFSSSPGGISTHGVTYRVTMRDIRGLIGSAGSTIEVDAVNTEHLTLTLSAGSSFVGRGTAMRFELDLSAGSRVNAALLTSRDVVAELSAGSNALLRATHSLTVNASAGSVLEYLGDPIVQAQTSGASIVRRAGA